MATEAGKLLREAADIVEGARNQQHGDKERSFAAIARRWGGYIFDRTGCDVQLYGVDVAAMMIELKLARSCYGERCRDHFLDIAGYAGCAWECEAAGEEEVFEFEDESKFKVGDMVRCNNHDGLMKILEVNDCAHVVRLSCGFFHHIDEIKAA